MYIDVMCPVCGRWCRNEVLPGEDPKEVRFILETELELEHYDYHWYDVYIIGG